MSAVVKHFLKYRPLSILAITGGVRDMLIGLGFLMSWEQIRKTLIFQNFDELVPGYSGMIVGAVFVLVGAAVVMAAAKYMRITMSTSLRVQALLWLFSTLMFILNGHYLLSVIFGLFFMIPAAYIAYYVDTHPAIDEQLETLLGRKIE